MANVCTTNIMTITNNRHEIQTSFLNSIHFLMIIIFLTHITGFVYKADDKSNKQLSTYKHSHNHRPLADTLYNTVQTIKCLLA